MFSFDLFFFAGSFMMPWRILIACWRQFETCLELTLRFVTGRMLAGILITRRAIFRFFALVFTHNVLH